MCGHLLRASEQIREDSRRAAGISPELSAETAFHLKHLAGSTERLCTYAEGGDLSREQLLGLAREHEAGEAAPELLRLIETALARYERIVRATPPEAFGEVRRVGRKKLPVTLIGLLIHIAEHGQRHVGQAITSAKARPR